MTGPIASRLAINCTLAISLCIASVTELTAQNIAGHVIDAATERPVPGLFVISLDSSGSELGRSLTNKQGTFQLHESASTLRVEQAGLESTDSSITHLSEAERLSIQLIIRQRAAELGDLSVAPTACVVDADSNALTKQLLAEAAKVLSAVAWSERRSDYLYDATEFTRVMDADRRIQSETTESVRNANIHPHTLREPFSSFSRASSLLAPDFRASNCFSIDRVGDVGVVMTFSRVDDSATAPRGQFVFDPGSAVLLATELGVGSQANSVHGSASERFEYRQLSDGAWMVGSWDTQVPVSADPATAEPVGTLQIGGSVTSVSKGDVSLFTDQRVSLLTGTVYDSTVGDVLPNAVVALSGSDHWTTTDASGSFFMAGRFEGRYDVVYGHPKLDSLGFISPVTTVDLRLGETDELELAVPRLETILSQRCPDGTLTSMRRALFGIVRDADGNPVAGADVSAFWQTIPRSLHGFAVDDHDAGGTTDALGTFTVCGIAVGREVVVRARDGELMSEFVPVTFDGSNVQIGDENQRGDRRIARLDLSLLPVEERTASIQGTVREEATGRPVDGVEISVAGTPYSVITDSTGSFTVGNLPPGTHRLTARRVGYRRVRRELAVTHGEAVILSGDALRMPSGVTELAPIVVEAEGVPLGQRHLVNSGFFDRRNLGFGSFATREEIESWNPTEMTDALRHMPGARIVPNPSYGIRGDTRRYLVQTSRSRCDALIFMDGMYMGTTADRRANIDFNLLINVQNIEAIEVYQGAQIPPRFNRPGGACGVVVLWTR